jgi:hypothetical protein
MLLHKLLQLLPAVEGWYLLGQLLVEFCMLIGLLQLCTHAGAAGLQVKH